MTIDIGVNLTSNRFDLDRERVLARAIEVNVNGFIIIGSDIEDSRAALDLCCKYQNCYATAGVHPHHAEHWNEQSLVSLRALARHSQVKAIGEAGLDFNRNYSSKKKQIHAFEKQIELAIEYQLPLYLHQRDAHDTLYPIMKTCRDQLQGAVAHCFTGGQKELEDYLNLDMHIGITGWICDERRGYHLHDLIKQIPLNRLMLETDSPYLLPRGVKIPTKIKRNEPAFLTHVLQRVALCLDKTEQEVAQATTKTAEDFFKFSTISTS